MSRPATRRANGRVHIAVSCFHLKSLRGGAKLRISAGTAIALRHNPMAVLQGAVTNGEEERPKHSPRRGEQIF
jgi:hypothetical protein